MVPLHQIPAQRGSLPWFQVPFQNIIPLIPYSGMGSTGYAGEHHSRQVTQYWWAMCFSPSIRADHPHTTPTLHCLGESGRVTAMPQLLREAPVPVLDPGNRGASCASKRPPPSNLQGIGTEFVVLLCVAGMEEPKYVLLILSIFECKWISGFSLQTFLRHC